MSKNYRFLAIYNGNWCFIYKVFDRYYLEDRTEVKKEDFIFIA